MGSNIIKEPKKKFPAIEEQRHKQMMHRHAHNAAHGSVVFAKKAVQRLHDLPSLTPRAVELVTQLGPILEELSTEMYTYRKELDGSIRMVTHKESTEEYNARHRETALRLARRL